jgi:hypothetical protein
MTRLRTRHAAALGALVIAAAVGACESDRASVFAPLPQQSIGFLLGPPPGPQVNLPRGTVVTARTSATAPGTVTATLSGLEPLTQGFYQVWLATLRTDTAKIDSVVKARGRILVTRIDTTFSPEGDPIPDTVTVLDDSTTGISAFTNGGPATHVRLTVDSTLLGFNPLRRNLLLVTLETDSGAAVTQPSQFRPLWATYAQAAAGTSSRAVLFGNFHPRPDSLRVFAMVGRGRAAVLGDVFVVNDSSLSRPPRGYYYATFIIERDENGVATDTVSFGPQTAPFPDRNVSLREADTALVHAVVQERPPAILAASARLEAGDIPGRGATTPPFRGFATLLVTLENKFGDEDSAGPVVILRATIPDAVRVGAAP